jgi:hypothetical protein
VDVVRLGEITILLVDDNYKAWNAADYTNRTTGRFSSIELGWRFIEYSVVPYIIVLPAICITGFEPI